MTGVYIQMDGKRQICVALSFDILGKIVYILDLWCQDALIVFNVEFFSRIKNTVMWQTIFIWVTLSQKGYRREPECFVRITTVE